MDISFVIIAYNAEKFLNNSLNCLLTQDYDLNKIQVILVNSSSCDNTKKIMINFQKKYKHKFKEILILNNNKKTLPYGWNLALNEANGEAIVRVDAHSKFPYNFISNNVKEMEKGENIVGGHRISITSDNSEWQKLLLIAEESLFGSGIAKYRRLDKREYVETLAHAMYRKKVFDTVGLYNVNLSRTEDNEIHYRMKKAGFKFLLSPSIVSYHCARNTFKGMIKQKYGNGKWIGITMYFCPKCFSLYHFVPFVFIMALIVCCVLYFFKLPIFMFILLGLYGLFNLINLIIIFINKKFSIRYLLLPFIFFILHFVYGFGTLIGLLIGPIYRIKVKGV